MLKPGERLPDYEGQALMPGGEFADINLANFRGRWMVLFFWPMDFTFVCPTEIQAFNELHPDFKDIDCQLLGVSVDSVFVHRAWTEHGLGKMDFPLIGDISKTLCESLDILDPDGVALRATYIVDPEGIVQSVTVNNLNVGRSARETLRLVSAFQTGELTACDWQPGEKFVEAA